MFSVLVSFGPPVMVVETSDVGSTIYSVKYLTEQAKYFISIEGITFRYGPVNYKIMALEVCQN